MTYPEADERYFALVRRFPLHPLRDDPDLDAAIAVVDELLDHGELSAGERDYLLVLSRLIEDYEEKHIQIPTLSGVQVLRHLMEENGMNQSDLVPCFGTKSIVSEVMNGKRPLALSHIRKLSEHFNVPADVFMS